MSTNYDPNRHIHCSERDCVKKPVVRLLISVLSIPTFWESKQRHVVFCEEHFIEFAKKYRFIDDNGNIGENYAMLNPEFYQIDEEPLTDFDMENDDIIG